MKSVQQQKHTNKKIDCLVCSIILKRVSYFSTYENNEKLKWVPLKSINTENIFGIHYTKILGAVQRYRAFIMFVQHG